MTSGGLIEKLKASIYKVYEDQADSEPLRPHLGASLIGNACLRASWYEFRWFDKPEFSGRMRKLFETGKLAEERIIAELTHNGIQVVAKDPKTDKQWSARDMTGHFGGSMDAIGIGFPDDPDTWYILEFKTHNESNFNKFKPKAGANKGVERSVREVRPDHYKQMQAYMGLTGIKQTIYFATNKNDEDYYLEIVTFDPNEFRILLNHSYDIVNAKKPLARINENPAWFECKFCSFKDVCYGNKEPLKNCRTCIHSEPIAGGEWRCNLLNKVLDYDQQVAGCPKHKTII